MATALLYLYNFHQVFQGKLAGHKSSLAGTPSPPFSVICAMSANLASFGRRKFVSTRALAEILQEVKRSGLPKAASKDSIKRAREKDVADMANGCGTLVTYLEFEREDPKRKPIGTVQLPFVNPLAFLRYIVGNAESYARYFSKYLDGAGESPHDPLEKLRLKG